MSFVDSFFEAISGWTGTGYSMIMQPEKSTMTILLWRSLMQWIGGIGVIVLMVSILIRPGTSTYIMYQSEARKDRILPSIRSTLKTIWFLYFALTVFGVIMLLAVGMPLWDSINHCMVAIGTGGFSIYADSIAHYNNFPIELVLMFIMFYGALPFVFLYKTVKKPKSLASIDPEVKAFVVLILIGTAVLAMELYLKHRGLFESLRLAAFQLVSGITCTGLQTSMMADWSPTALLILSIAMIIGGCAGSTAGGIKVARAIFLTSELELWMKRTLLPRNAIVTIKMGNKRLNEDVINKELAEAALISFLWIICILVSVMIMSHVVSPDYDLSKTIFTVCSCQGNVGLWCGIVDPGLHIAGKIMLMINMWIGRLEIIPVTLLIRYLFKGFKL
jgi:trk system potassium uptake protein TrkH